MIDDPLLYNDWHPVASLHELQAQPVLARRLLGEDLVVWQTGGAIHVWRDLCIHRGAKLSLGKVTQDCLACPYHGWRYDATGACVYMPAHPDQTPPAKAKTQTYPVQICYDLVWTCLGEPAYELPPFPEWGQPSFVQAACGPFAGVRAHGPRLIENFLDATHFAFVHAGVLGDPAHAEIGDYEVRVEAQGVFGDPIAVYQPNPYGDQAGHVHYIYSVFRPLTAHFTKLSAHARNGLLLVVTPNDELESTAWFVVATNTSTDRERLRVEYTPRIGAIFAEDRTIVESQRPELLPLDLQAELHLRSDRMAIGYRTWLRRLGLRYGAV